MQSEKQKNLSLCQCVIRELDAIAKQQEDVGAGMGLEQAVHWTGRSSATVGKMQDSDISAKPVAGNLANAVVGGDCISSSCESYHY
jgi:hypothetical protein